MVLDPRASRDDLNYQTEYPQWFWRQGWERVSMSGKLFLSPCYFAFASPFYAPVSSAWFRMIDKSHHIIVTLKQTATHRLHVKGPFTLFSRFNVSEFAFKVILSILSNLCIGFFFLAESRNRYTSTLVECLQVHSSSSSDKYHTKF